MKEEKEILLKGLTIKFTRIKQLFHVVASTIHFIYRKNT